MRIAVAALLLSTPALGQSILPTTILKEGDALAGSTISAISQVATNRNTGFALNLGFADGVSRFWGNAVRGPGAVLRSEGTVGIYQQTSFESFFGFSNSGAIAYSPSVTFGTVTSGDAVFLDDSALAVETEAIPSIPGQFWRFASRPTATGTGEAWWAAGLTSTSGGPTQTRGLFRGNGISVLRSGDFVTGATEAINSATAVSFDFGVSGAGTNYICEVTLTAASAIDTAVVRNGAIITTEGGLIREGEIIPVAAGGDGFLFWQNFDFMGITESGRYFFTGDDNNIATSDEFIVRDGRIVFRDGSVVDGQTLQGDIEAAVMNEQGDLAFTWDINANATEAIYLNRRLIVKEGDTIDFDGNGTADADAPITDFTGISNLAVTGRDGARVDVYFTADIDRDGNLTTTADRVEVALSVRVCLNDINRDGSVTVQDIFDYLQAYFSNNLTADVSNDGLLSVQDIFDFLTLYFAGCPA